MFSIDNFRQVHPTIVDVASIRAGLATTVQDLDSCSQNHGADKLTPQSSLDQFSQLPEEWSIRTSNTKQIRFVTCCFQSVKLLISVKTIIIFVCFLFFTYC